MSLPLYFFESISSSNSYLSSSLLYHTFANKSRRSLVWNPQLVAVWTWHAVTYGISRKGWMASSRREFDLIRAPRNAMRDFVAIPYNAQDALMPYQACGLNKPKRNFWLVAEMGFELYDFGVLTIVNS